MIRFIVLFFLPLFLSAYDWGDYNYSPLPQCNDTWVPAASVGGESDQYVDEIKPYYPTPVVSGGWSIQGDGSYFRYRRGSELDHRQCDNADCSNYTDYYHVFYYGQYVKCSPTPYCDPGYHYDFDIAQCVGDCPPNASSDPDNPEACKCNDGYEPYYDIDGSFECKEKQCDPIVGDLPFFLKVSPADISLCNFFPLSDSNFVTLDPLTGCCYGQPNIEDNSTCPSNNIEINGKCYPITSSDDNKTPVSHDCPTGEYWSFSANGGDGGCVPFFPDDNGTDPLPSDSGLDGTITDENGTSSNIDFGYNFDNLDQDQDFVDGLVSDAVNLDGVTIELNKLLNSYVLIDLPLQASGSCDTELVKTITVMGSSYTIDARPWVSKFMEYIPMIRTLVIFSFIFAGVLIVLGRGGD